MNISRLNFAYGDKIIFKDLNLDIQQGKITCIMGGSGCGKTTLLNCISKQLEYGGNIEGNDGKLAYVFQQPRLIPSLSVEDNIRFVLPKSIDRQQANSRVDEIIAKLKLDDCRRSLPSKISGGQASRVSLARALVTDCEILLLDEPFKGLDIKLKNEILDLVIPLIADKIVIFVTHDVEEALTMADRVYIFERSDGEGVAIKGLVDIAQNQRNRDIYGEELNKLRREIYALLS